MSPIAYTGAIIAVAVVLFVTNRVPVVLVAMGTALALWATGVLTLPQALGGLGDPAVIFIASLFVVSSGLEMTGVTAWAGQLLIKGAGEESRTRLLLLTMGLVALLTALISVNGAVAALLPVVVVIAVRLRRNSSQLLMPLVFAAHAGSMLALTGTPVNVLVSEAGMDAGVGGFGFFEFALVGVPLLAGSMAIMVLFGERLLPQRNGATMPADFSRHAKTLVEQYGLASGIYQLRVRASCPYVGKPTSAIDLTDYPLLQLVAIQDGPTAGPLRRETIAEGDHLLLRGDAEAAASFAAQLHLAFREDGAPAGEGEETLFNRRSGLAEVVIPPRSGLIGQSVFPGMVTDSGDLIILAVQRGGNEIAAESSGASGGVVLNAGDTMLLQGTWKALDTHLDDPDVLVVSSPELVRRQAVPMGPGAKQAVIILFGMVLMLATGVVPPAVAGLLAAGAIILTGIMTVEQSYRAISWTTVILVGAMMPLSTAMVETGAAKLLAERLVVMVGDAGPMALLAGLFILTAIMGQLISNTATALIVIPIGIAAAASMGISPKPVLISTAVAA
ncbi:MAG: SLC13 family permease, partial [Bosea sp. (in: a-proteobacteria)]